MNNKSDALKEAVEHARTPKVRFPEFRDAEGWKETELGQFGKTVSGLTYAPKDVRDSGLLVLRSSNVQNGKIALDDCVYVTPNVKGANLSKPNDILICVRNGSISLIGKNAIIPKEMPLCTHGAFMTIFRSEAPKFVYQLLQTQAYITQVAADLGARINSINNSQLLKYKFWIPPTEAEQEKIAECLTSLDELITAHSQKLDALKIHKKGLMQQLFPGEGEIIPRVRFSEFRKAKVWTKRKISEVLSKVSMPITVEDKTLYREIGVRSHGKGIFHKEPITGTAIGEKRVFRVVEDALVLNIVFAWEQAVATTSKEETGMIASHRFPMYVAKSETCDVRFVKNAFLTPQGKHLLGVASPGGAGRNRTLGQEEFENLSITLPDKEEQTKIADTIQTADDLITSQAVEVETLKRHKKGLMQQLFPSPEEVEA